jgi:hypothetical protein
MTKGFVHTVNEFDCTLQTISLESITLSVFAYFGDLKEFWLRVNLIFLDASVASGLILTLRVNVPVPFGNSNEAVVAKLRPAVFAAVVKEAADQPVPTKKLVASVFGVISSMNLPLYSSTTLSIVLIRLATVPEDHST